MCWAWGCFLSWNRKNNFLQASFAIRRLPGISNPFHSHRIIRLFWCTFTDENCLKTGHSCMTMLRYPFKLRVKYAVIMVISKTLIRHNILLKEKRHLNLRCKSDAKRCRQMDAKDLEWEHQTVPSHVEPL